MSQFRKCVINQFYFLEQFGYILLEEKDINLVSYKGKNNRIDVTFSPIGYELTCQFTDDMDNNFSLQDSLEYENIIDYKGLYQIANKTDIEEGISYLSQVVRKLFERIDISEPQNFKKIYQFRIDTHKKLLNNYYLETDLKRAESYWKKKDYTKAKELFKKNIEHLSQSQLKKLEYIEKQDKSIK